MKLPEKYAKQKMTRHTVESRQMGEAMFKSFKTIAAAIAISALSLPAAAQEAEQPRTTYSITFLAFANGGDVRWDEIMTENVAPARAAAGLPAVEVHWFAGGPWDIMVEAEMPGGMASLDRHMNANNASLQAAMVAQLGSEEAADALWDELNALVTTSERYYTHTHP